MSMSALPLLASVEDYLRIISNMRRLATIVHKAGSEVIGSWDAGRYSKVQPKGGRRHFVVRAMRLSTSPPMTAFMTGSEVYVDGGLPQV